MAYPELTSDEVALGYGGQQGAREVTDAPSPVRIDSRIEAHAVAIARGYELLRVAGPPHPAYIPEPVPSPDQNMVGLCASMDPAFVASILPAALTAINARQNMLTALVAELTTLQTALSG